MHNFKSPFRWLHPFVALEDIQVTIKIVSINNYKMFFSEYVIIKAIKNTNITIRGDCKKE